MTVSMARAVTWQLHDYYVADNIRNVYDTGEKIYFLNSNCLYQFDKETKAIVPINFQNRLFDNQISQIYYDWENRLLFVAYANSNIDVIDASSGKVTNISGIKDMNVMVHDFTLEAGVLTEYVGKEIRDITFAGGKAYVAMGCGFAIIDEATLTIVRTVEVRNTICVNSVARIGDDLVIVSNRNTYYGDPDADDPINTYKVRSGTFTDARMYPIDDHSTFIMTNSRLYYYDFSVATPALTRVVNALPTCVQKSPTGYIANFAGQSYYYTIDATGLTATQQGTTPGFATSDPNGDGTVWINDADGLHISGSTICYKNNALTTDKPYWLKYNAAMDKLYAAVSGPIALINNNSVSEANVINTYDGSQWTDATAYRAAGGAYAFEFSPLDPTTYVRASWNRGIHKVTNDELKVTYTKASSKIGGTKPTPAFDNYGNLWVVSSYLSSTEVGTIPPVAVLPADKFAKAIVTKNDWFEPTGLSRLRTGNMQRSRFLVSKKNNVKIFIDGDFPTSPGNATFFCWDNGEVDPKIDTYHLAAVTYFIDQDDHQLTWTYVNHIEQDKSGNIWVGHSSGLFMFDPDSVFEERPRAIRPFVTQPSDSRGYLCEGSNVYDIGVDRADNKWLATDDGVFYTSPDGSEIYYHFTTANSDLPDNMVYSIECDTVNDRVYIYTGSGFAEYVPQGDAPTLDFNNVVAIPNPVEPDYTGYVKIDHLMDNSFVTITNREGTVVAQLGPVKGRALWDGAGTDGERLPTGTYNIYTAQGGWPTVAGEPQATIMIIR